MPEVRTRFAPSPTGHLHIGGARTALFNYLFARHHGGSFVLRIEDTDRQRSSQEFVDAILDSLEWLGLDYDEGPHFQSQRSDHYAGAVSRLLENGHCYHCFCPPERLESMREQAQKEGRKPFYDRTCRDAGRTPGDGEASVIRFKAPLDGQTMVNDLVRGPVSFDNRELDDLILVRSDGTPTFHLVVVCDDIDMGITHVLRGEDHLSNTPRQLQIFKALGAEPPAYGHLPLIVGTDRARLSKRHGATSVSAYRDMGLLPDALVNYLARLGWSHGDQEVFSRDELVELFDVDGVGKAAAAFDIEKLTWVNGEHMKRVGAESLAPMVRPWLEDSAANADDHLEAAVALIGDRAKTLVQLAERVRPFVVGEIDFDEKAAAKFLAEENLQVLDALSALLEGVGDWSEEGVEGAFRELMERDGLKLGKLAQPVRVALTGGTESPGIFEVCVLLGKETTLARLRAAVGMVREGNLPIRAA